MSKTLEEGIYIQIYRGSMRAQQRNNIKSTLKVFKKLDVKGIAWHGFVNEMTPEVFKQLTTLCSDEGLISMAAFGLNSMKPEEVGSKLGDVANTKDCHAVIFDCEAAWEDEKHEVEAAKAIALGKAFRDKAPNILTIDQPWPDPVPRKHWGTFPYEEFAEFIDIRAPQFYVNNSMKSLGKDRYKTKWEEYLKDWEYLDKRLARSNLVKPEIYTIQGYSWDEIYSDLVHCVTKNPTLIIWAEPFPEEDVLLALKVRKLLREKGFSGEFAVKLFQQDWNKSNQNDKLSEDNVFGPKTASKLGSDLYPID